MQTLEYLLATTALLGILGLLVAPLHDLQDHLAHTRDNLEAHETELTCSTRADNTMSHFIRTDANGCWNYSYTVHESPDAFALTLQGSGHYA